MLKSKENFGIQKKLDQKTKQNFYPEIEKGRKEYNLI